MGSPSSCEFVHSCRSLETRSRQPSAPERWPGVAGPCLPADGQERIPNVVRSIVERPSARRESGQVADPARFGPAPGPPRRPPRARRVRRPVAPLDVPGEQHERLRHGLPPPGDPRFQRRRRAGEHDRLQHQRGQPRDRPAQAVAGGRHPGDHRRHHPARLHERPGRRAGRLPAGHHRPGHHRRQEHGRRACRSRSSARPASPSTATAGTRSRATAIGTDVAGVVAAGNGTGVRIASPNNTIGGTTPGARNVISGNTTGVSIAAADGDRQRDRGQLSSAPTPRGRARSATRARASTSGHPGTTVGGTGVGRGQRDLGQRGRRPGRGE